MKRTGVATYFDVISAPPLSCCQRLACAPTPWITLLCPKEEKSFIDLLDPLASMSLIILVEELDDGDGEENTPFSSAPTKKNDKCPPSSVGVIKEEVPPIPSSLSVSSSITWIAVREEADNGDTSPMLSRYCVIIVGCVFAFRVC